ncbi:methyltransferase family protein [Vibrio sp.]|uniref:methyltransferase family protein n=1 Tax=Vibrio sp. TaxID=678 RepID=UPI003D100FA0
MNKLELKVPPVVLFLIALVLIDRIAEIFYTFDIPLPLPLLVFAGCFVVSGFVGLAGIVEFRRAKTTVHPGKPENASTIVSSGIFAYSRNPMYLGLLLLLFGFAYWQQNALSMTVCLLFVGYMNRFQIEPEERILEQYFGEDYLVYKRRVRRWI